MIVDAITDLRRKHKRADCKRIPKEIVKLADFSKISKEDLMNRIDTLLIENSEQKKSKLRLLLRQ